MKQLSDCWLVAIPGVAKLLDNFPFRSSLHYSTLYSLTLIRRTDSWRVEEVHVWYVCDWELQDNISAMAKNLRSILPAQIHRVSIQKPEVSANGLAYAASVLTKQGLSVRWR
ncbi:hypothetical protein VKT23_001359 [Stygiomarasmius scandens]|uniref:Uncharacterized protein n=1 Tax=Marasmiellus scandens TaxID=2682957 RepID=A0ABR1K6U8_9AGAR